MCESAAYLLSKDGEKKIMDNVINMKPEDGKIYLTGLLGEEMVVKGKIKEIKLLSHKIIIEEE
jgi:predicted RNA-binding protein